MADPADDGERRWREDQERHGFTLPPPAPWPLRLPVIRNVRHAVLAYRIDRWRRAWGALTASAWDHWVLYAIWRGWC